MKDIGFNQIFILSNKGLENDLYEQYHFPEMLLRYDSSFIRFKRMPSIYQFKDAETYLRDFHSKHGQDHVKFIFPENQSISKELKKYLFDKDYILGFLELYKINPSHFPSIDKNEMINVQVVKESNQEDFLTLNYLFDRNISDTFAQQKLKINRKLLNKENMIHLIAYYDDIPAGSLHLIISEQTVEIDHLEVLKSFQGKGIATHLQNHVMTLFPSKTVILVADGEDTPRLMYRKQNYQYSGFQYYALNVFE